MHLKEIFEGPFSDSWKDIFHNGFLRTIRSSNFTELCVFANIGNEMFMLHISLFFPSWKSCCIFTPDKYFRREHCNCAEWRDTAWTLLCAFRLPGRDTPASPSCVWCGRSPQLPWAPSQGLWRLLQAGCLFKGRCTGIIEHCEIELSRWNLHNR